MDDQITSYSGGFEIKNQENKSNKKILLALGLILLILPMGIGIYFVSSKKPTEGKKAQAVADEQKEIENLEKEISKVMVLPNEQPVLATVSDLEVVRGQEFFKNARIGDKVLVYKVARKAILYRPMEQLIVEVGTVNQSTVSDVAGDATTIDPTTIPNISPTPTIVVPTYQPVITE